MDCIEAEEGAEEVRLDALRPSEGLWAKQV
jgi:hypothetical protein